MDLEAHRGGTMFLVPLAKQEKFVFKPDCILIRKYFVPHISLLKNNLTLIYIRKQGVCNNNPQKKPLKEAINYSKLEYLREKKVEIKESKTSTDKRIL